MPIDQTAKPEETKGLLALGLEAGQSLPFLDELGIPNRVDEEGRVQWQVHDAMSLWLDWTYPYRDYLAKKEDRVYRDIFRGINMFVRALMGFPVRPQLGGWPVPTLPAPYSPNEVSTLWEVAPNEIQRIAFSTLQYLQPQL